jgi:PAS domain S-box-containing protein
VPKEEEKKSSNTSRELTDLDWRFHPWLLHIMSQFEALLDNDNIYKTLSFVVSDPRVPDNPIVYASREFYTVTGYTPAEVLGKNCRLLQGKDTSRHAIGEIRDAIREERDTSVCLLNYRKDGRPFWNAFHLHPVQDSSGQVKLFIGIQCDITSLFMIPDPNNDLDEASLNDTNRTNEDTARRLAEDISKHGKELLNMSALSGTSCVSDSVATSLISGLGNIDHAFVLTDPNLENNPMVYCSHGFLRMTGYSADELLGRSCSMLQGDGTDQNEVQKIREALRHDPPKPVSAVLKNYRKNGDAFYNALYIAPVNCANGQIKYFCGIQSEVKIHKNFSGSSSCPTSVPVGDTLMRLRQRGVLGAVRVATRGLGDKALSRKPDHQKPFDSKSCAF